MNCMCETGMVELCNMSCPNYQKYVEEFIKDEEESAGPLPRGVGTDEPLSTAGNSRDESVVRKDR